TQGHCAENLAVIRHLALNLLSQEKSSKGGTHAKSVFVNKYCEGIEGYQSKDVSGKQRYMRQGYGTTQNLQQRYDR
ncbi:MAG TPA: hypothetical protein V6C65_20115, partial [Allocoleopsis sp.]